MKRPMMICMFIVLIIVVQGCGYKDIDKRFFVVSTGIEKSPEKDKKYRIWLKLVIPQTQLKAGKEEFVIIKHDADTVSEAVRVIKSTVDKELDFGHMKVILLGEDLVKSDNDLHDVLDWFARRRDIQKIAWMGIARPTVKEVLSAKPKSERLPSNALLLSFGQTGTETAYITSEYLFDFMRRLKERGKDPILPIIELYKEDGELFRINKVAVFDKKKMVVELTPDQTKILNYMISNISKFDLKVNKDPYFMIAVQDIKCRYHITEKDGRATIHVNIHARGTIEEAKQRLSGEKIDKYEKLTEEVMKPRILKVLTTLQEKGVDPVGFGLWYRAHHSNNETKWEKWQRLYPDAEFVVHTKVDIDSIGTIH